jgi:hypothetical protein
MSGMSCCQETRPATRATSGIPHCAGIVRAEGARAATPEPDADGMTERHLVVVDAPQQMAPGGVPGGARIEDLLTAAHERALMQRKGVVADHIPILAEADRCE